jgi:hypothetical protein
MDAFSHPEPCKKYVCAGSVWYTGGRQAYGSLEKVFHPFPYEITFDILIP